MGLSAMTKSDSSKTVRRHACVVCGQAFPASKMRPFIAVRPGVSELIADAAPGWIKGKHICKPDLGRFRRQYIEQLRKDERGKLGELDRQVIDLLEENIDDCR